MKLNSIFLAISLALSSASTAQSSDWQTALKTIVDNNPRLRIAEGEAKAARIANNAAGSSEFAPEIDYTQTFGHEGSKIDAGVSMGFDWPGLYDKRKAYAESENNALDYLVAAERIEVVQQAMQLITDGAYAEARLRDLAQVLATLERAQAIINRGYEGGQLTIIDVRKAELEVTSARLRVADVEAELDNVRAALAELAGQPDFDVDFSVYLPLTLPDLESCRKGAEHMPEVLAARAQAEAQRALFNVEKAQRKPGFSVGYVFQREINQNFNGFSIGLRLPMRSRLYAEAAQSQAVQFDNSAETLVTAAQLKALKLHSRATALRAKIDALSAAALGNNYVELVEKAWRGGQINVITYLQEVGYYIDTRMAVLDLEHEYRLALVNLARFAH